MEKIKDVLNGTITEYSFADSDWCIIEVRDEETTISNGFNEFEPIKIKTNRFYSFLDKWNKFLENLENENLSHVNENSTNYNGISRIDSRKKIFCSSLKYFDQIMQKHKMEKEIDSNYEYGAAKFSNGRCEIHIAMDRYCENLEMELIDILKNQSYNWTSIFKTLDLEKNKMPYNKNLMRQNQLEGRIEFFAYVLENNCSEILDGNFSSLKL